MCKPIEVIIGDTEKEKGEEDTMLLHVTEIAEYIEPESEVLLGPREGEEWIHITLPGCDYSE